MIAGAYALTASLPAFTEADAQAFYAELTTLPGLEGLELPLHRLEKADDPWRHLHLLPRHWTYVLTPLPFVMQSLEQHPLFGLASPDAAGRAAAVQAIVDLQQRIQRLEDHCGRAVVRAVELHSAPTARAETIFLRESLQRIRAHDWGAVELWIEHCDSPSPGRKPAKGFLDFESELSLAQEFHLGMNINWGRSVLEARSQAAPLEQLIQARAAGVLRSVFFSGVAAGDPIYGDWLDNHAPMQWDAITPWMPKGSLLSLDAAEAILEAVAEMERPVTIGVKVQPAPASLTLTQRIDCLRLHLDKLQTLDSHKKII